MKRHLIIIFSLFCYFGFSQCEDSDKLDLGGTYLSKTNNYIPFDIKYKDSIYLENISYPQDLKKIEKYFDFIYEKSKVYIESRGGKDFFKNLKFEHLEVNFDENSGYDYAKESTYELSNFEYYSYWILYTYTNSNIKYAFGLEFDKNGKMISENKFPKYSENFGFENITNYCSALEIVKKDRRFKDKIVDYIELAYLDNINSFCWLIVEKPKPNKELGKWEEKKVNQYYVNANTDKLESVIEKKSMSIACGAILLPLKSKKQLRKENRERNRNDRK